jgi:ankyrin repeat protein
MLQRIHANGLKLLHWVLFAERPLMEEELRWAIAIEFDMIDFNPDLDLPPLSFIDAALGLLVTENKNRVVRFAHLTVKDYLLQHSKQYFPSGHTLLARTTLTYLSFSALADNLARYAGDGDLHPFFNYAAFEWGHHVRQQSDAGVVAMAKEWLFSTSFKNVGHLRELEEEEWHRELLCEHSPLHEACYFSLESFVRELVHLQPDVMMNSTEELGRSPLHFAAAWGDVNLLRIFLHYSTIGVNLPDKHGWTALHWAAAEGQKDVVQVLLHHSDIDINSLDRGGGTPVCHALDSLVSPARLDANFKMWHRDVIRMLVQDCRIAHVNPKTTYGQRTLLHVAAERRYDDIVTFLLRHPGIDVNASDPEGQTPLSCATESCAEEAVRMLLTHKAIDVNPRIAIWKRTPLIMAVERGYDVIVNTLLRHPNIDVNALDVVGWTPLSCAAHRGRNEITGMLLEHKAINLELSRLRALVVGGRRILTFPRDLLFQLGIPADRINNIGPGHARSQLAMPIPAMHATLHPLTLRRNPIANDGTLPPLSLVRRIRFSFHWILMTI